MKNYFIYSFPFGDTLIAEEGGCITNITMADAFDKKAAVLKETPLIKKAAAQLKKYIKGEIKSFELPLAPEGTPFQKKVWAELLKIPYGETKSYGDIAAAVGNRKAARAVGGANNKNPICIVIPCHRVIGAKGGLVGYAYGTEFKQRLLDMEAAFGKK